MRLLGLLLIVSLGCGDDSSDPDAGPPPADGAVGSLPLDTVPIDDPGPFPTTPPEGTCDFRGGSGVTSTDACTDESSAFFFVSRIEFPEIVDVEGARNRVAGFDLDGMDSDGRDGCRQLDYVSLDGRFGGVDNLGAALVPSIDMILDSDLRTTAATAIAEGRFGVLIELRHWNGTGDDECVDVVVHQVSPVAELDLDATGAPTGGQTFVTEGTRAFLSERLAGGELRADLGGFPVPQPFMMDLQSAHLRLRFDGERFEGIVAGDMPSSLVVDTLFCREPRFTRSILEDIVRSVSDLRPNPSGTCQGVSWALEIETVDAFLGDA